MKSTREYLSSMSKYLQELADDPNLSLDLIKDNAYTIDKITRISYLQSVKDAVLSELSDYVEILFSNEDTAFYVSKRFGDTARHYEVKAYNFGGEISLSSFTCKEEYFELYKVNFIDEQEYKANHFEPRVYSASRTVAKLIEKIKNDAKTLAVETDTTRIYKLVIESHKYEHFNGICYEVKHFRHMKLFNTDDNTLKAKPLHDAFNDAAFDYRSNASRHGEITRFNITDDKMFSNYARFLKSIDIDKKCVNVMYVNHEHVIR